jgi:hypothetical protein
LPTVNDHVDPATDQVCHDLLESLEPALRRPPLQNEILAFDVTQDAQRSHEGSDKGMDRFRSPHLGDWARG